MKAVGAKADDVNIAGAARRAEEMEVIHGLEQVGLALSIVADDGDPIRGRCQLDMGEIPKISHI